MRLGLRQLEILRLFSRTHSVTETARLLRVSQPAVSQTIKEIEGLLGFAIIVRFGNKTRLTDEARAILPQVERVLSQMSSLLGHAEELRDSKAGSLSIAAAPTLFDEVMPKAVGSFLAEHDKVRVRAEVHVADDIVRQVRQDSAHIGFLFLPIDETGIAVQPIMQMNAVCVVPPDNPLAKKPFVTAKDLRDDLLVVQDVHSPAGFVINQQIEDDLSGARILRVNQSIAAMRMVNERVGIAIAHPLTVSGGMIGQCVAVPLRPEVKMVLAMIYPRQKPVSRLVMRFEKHFRKAAADFCQRMQAQGYSCEMLL